MKKILSLTLLMSSVVCAQNNEAIESTTATASATPAQLTTPSASSTLEDAFKKEFAFLEVQKKSLEDQLSKFQANAKSEQKKQATYIRGLEVELVTMNSEMEALQDEMLDAERLAASITDQKDTLEATFQQAQATLEQKKILDKGFDELQDQEKIQTLFTGVMNEIEKLSSVYTEPGEFYLPDGSQIQGQITHIGNIAAYGASSSGSGALAPAGEGRLKVWKNANPETAQAFVNGTAPAFMDIFIYESLNKAIEEKKEKTALKIIQDGGTIAWVIVALGVLGLLLVLLRVFFLNRSSASIGKVSKRIGSKIKKGDVQGALKACHGSNNAICRVISATLRNLDRDREHLEDIISEAILHESTFLNRFGAAILVIAAVSPLLGLLGTVTGMISTFDVITEFGTGDPKMLSGGISIALITTEIGLIVAIPTLILGNMLSGWAENIKSDMEHAALHVMNQYQDFRNGETTSDESGSQLA